MIISQADRSKLCVIQACSLPCRNHGAGHAVSCAGWGHPIACKGAASRVRCTGEGVQTAVFL